MGLRFVLATPQPRCHSQAVQLGAAAVSELRLPECAAPQGSDEDGPQGRPDAPCLISLCPMSHRALLRKLGGLFLPSEANLSLDSSEGLLARAVVQVVIDQLLVSGQPLLIFLEEPPGALGPRLSALGQAWLGFVVRVVQVGIIPDALLVPVAVTYDLVPDAPCDIYHASAPLGLWTGALAVLRSLCSHLGCSRQICSRVHLAQPFSLQCGELCGAEQGHHNHLLVVTRPRPGLTHLTRLSAELLPVFLSEAVGACAVRGLLVGSAAQGPWELQGIELLSQNELYHQILLLMHLLPQELLLLQAFPSWW
ncbi:hypothetical protein P7K49_029785 [Saguinus oedipus]|uniref:Phospholipid/glycerol acyltransferase domain-containing protein n=1 Tax=Saguinus oedipus TaxID=9490 RepID=A0ABQ9U8A2_SAGOE|nr:hypothetical protein P7K49_029785 [Saguinus oedipus]